jgi:Cellulose binding domain
MSRFLGVSVRGRRGRVLALCVAAAVAIAAITTVAIALTGGSTGSVSTLNAGSPRGLEASYRTVDRWRTGYTGQYTITNAGTSAVTAWTLAFRLPAGTTVTSLWDGVYTEAQGQVTVRNASWDGTIKPGGSVSVGFEASSAGQVGLPVGCTIDGASCSGPAVTTPQPPIAAPSVTASQNGVPSASTAGFAPYVDVNLDPPYSLVSTARQTGVKQFNLAFIIAPGSGGCTPEWGGVTPVGDNPVAAQIGALRAIGGDVRISFGGEAGEELALTCSSAAQLEAAYQEVISAYHVTKIDFDIEGTALADTAANALRDQALAALQRKDNLQISFTLPVIPSGLESQEIALLTGAVQAGVRISAVDIMTMDYGDGVAPDPSGMMGTYAIQAATAADAQVASLLGISDDAAWSKIAVTPMIGQNDISDEIFTLANARQVEAFATSKHLAWLSMWSAARDTACPGDAQLSAQNTCSSIGQSSGAFAAALGAYRT